MPKRNNKITDRIRELRKQGCNQVQAAEILGCTQGNISYHSRKYGIKWPIGAASRDQTGDKNPNFINGMAKSTIERLTRKIVLESGRCLFTCEGCGDFNKEQEQPRHHVDQDRSNNHPDNLEVLCISCHSKLHNTQKERDANGRFIN